MLVLNLPIDYLHFLWVYVVYDGLREGAKRYMLMGPFVSIADSSSIRRYYPKKTQPCTCTNTPPQTQVLEARKAHKCITQSREAERD